MARGALPFGILGEGKFECLSLAVQGDDLDTFWTVSVAVNLDLALGTLDADRRPCNIAVVWSSGDSHTGCGDAYSLVLGEVQEYGRGLVGASLVIWMYGSCYGRRLSWLGLSEIKSLEDPGKRVDSQIQ